MGSCLSVWLAFIHDTPAEPVLLKPSGTLGLCYPPWIPDPLEAPEKTLA